MSQVCQCISVLARKIEPKFGGDIRFKLAVAFAGITYPIAQYIKKKLG